MEEDSGALLIIREPSENVEGIMIIAGSSPEGQNPNGKGISGDTPKNRKCPKCKAECEKLEMGWICTQCSWSEDVNSHEDKVRHG